MSNAQRAKAPQRTRTPADEKARIAELDKSFSFAINGEVYTLVMADVTGLVEMRVRRDTGLPVAEIIAKMESTPGIDLVAYFMYACKLASGAKADLEEILGSVSWADVVELVDAEGNEVPQP